MKPRTLAQLIAAGRIAVGATLLLAPTVVTRRWVGEREGEHLGTRVMAAGLGGRDIVVGAGVLAALRSGEGARLWLIGSAAADVIDLVSTVRHAGELPASAVAGTVAVAGGAAVAGAWVVAQGEL